MARSKNSAQKAKAIDVEREALKLRRQGLTYAAIGDALGMSESGAYYAVDRGLEKATQLVTKEADRLRQLEVQRLDRMQEGLWPTAETGDHKSIDRVLRIIAERAKLLGLYAPTAIDVKSSRFDGVDLGSLSVEQLRRLKAGESVEAVIGSGEA